MPFPVYLTLLPTTIIGIFVKRVQIIAKIGQISGSLCSVLSQILYETALRQLRGRRHGVPAMLLVIVWRYCAALAAATTAHASAKGGYITRKWFAS